MSPLSTTRVIHRDFSAHHQPVAEGTMTATCRVERPAIGTHWDPVTESTVPNPPDVLISSSICKVQEYMRAAGKDQVGQQVVERRYRVSLPADVAPIDVKCHVVFLASSDAALATRTFYVDDVQYATERFERVLICLDNLG